MSDPIELTLEQKVDHFVSKVFGGEHHCRKVVFAGNHYVVVPNTPSVSTFDGDRLTRIVLASHELGLRAELTNHGMIGIKILLHSRTTRKVGKYWERHPTIEDAVEAYNN